MRSVDVVLPCYNGEKYLKRSVSSVEAQTYQNWNLFIVDDCSTDGSLAVAKELASADKRIHVVSNPRNLGTGGARNNGIQSGYGDLIAFLDADDEWDLDFLEKQIAFMDAHKAEIVTSSYRRISARKTTNYIVPANMTWSSILKGNPISSLTTLFTRSLVKNVRFDLGLKKNEDLNFWCDLLRQNKAECLGNPEVLASYYLLPGSRSRNKMKLIRYQLAVYRKQKINFFKSQYYLIRWACYGIKKYRGAE